MKTNMPVLDIDKLSETLSDEELAWVKEIIKKDGQMYAGKPGKASGEAKYIWRMVSFFLSPKRQHNCIPYSADFDLNYKTEEGKWDLERVRKTTKEVLDPCVNKIVDTVDIKSQHGTMRWGRALGQIY